MVVPTFLVPALENIYISPSELCNLHCKDCYTQKTRPLLTEATITSFIARYQSFLATNQLTLKSILFCGGEVFTLKWFIPLVNSLLSQKIFITVITNGTINHLSQISDPQNCQLIVSLDGPKSVHDQNRGLGNFQKSLSFVKNALKFGFPTEIFYLVTKDSYPFIDTFSNYLSKKLAHQSTGELKITYLTDRLGSLTQAQVLNIKRNYPTYPNRRFGCFQLSLQADAQFYGCCESNQPLGTLNDPLNVIVSNFTQSLSPCLSCPQTLVSQKSSQALRRCFGCCQPNYLCGYTKEFNQPNCHLVVQSLHDAS
ncbi:MAG: radical SAM protein [Candidatus Shapirobacteria bacterium]